MTDIQSGCVTKIDEHVFEQLGQSQMMQILKTTQLMLLYV